MKLATIPKLAAVAQLETERLVLRQWQETDKIPFAQLCSDPQVMRYFPEQLNKNESDALSQKIKALIDERGYGFWAVSLKENIPHVPTTLTTNRFIGFVGLHWQTQVMPDQPFMEIGWRLHRHFWRQGYALEAAKSALAFAFETLTLNQVYAFTATANIPSQKLMTRLGMQNQNRDFAHPALPSGHALQAHCLYAITRQQFEKLNLV
ncbi:GNAT family N-acetyltransferase [Pseudoalteromonas luteoviolacea]|uniref:GNAT family N-acetyltransferase n=1 Tax=Pseudoalteromonas luteoviolacea TaxID=43657 RepID=UPI001F1F3B2D|nr:GNAT family N-acetyltransferase [Pseudoalteromonas luteoviolacea]